MVARKGGLIEADIDQEIVALNIETGICYGLNGAGSRIWNLMQTPIRISDICASLVAEFEVEPDDCERDVIGLIEQLLSENLVAVTNEA